MGLKVLTLNLQWLPPKGGSRVNPLSSVFESIHRVSLPGVLRSFWNKDNKTHAQLPHGADPKTRGKEPSGMEGPRCRPHFLLKRNEERPCFGNVCIWNAVTLNAMALSDSQGQSSKCGRLATRRCPWPTYTPAHWLSWGVCVTSPGLKNGSWTGFSAAASWKQASRFPTGFVGGAYAQGDTIFLLILASHRTKIIESWKELPKMKQFNPQIFLMKKARLSEMPQRGGGGSRGLGLISGIPRPLLPRSLISLTFSSTSSGISNPLPPPSSWRPPSKAFCCCYLGNQQPSSNVFLQQSWCSQTSVWLTWVHGEASL